MVGGASRPWRRPGHPPAVLLRGDMDALPVTEQTGEPFAAAAGHDARLRPRPAHRRPGRRGDPAQPRIARPLAGDVVFMFQPGEEGWDGAERDDRRGRAGRRRSTGLGRVRAARLLQPPAARRLRDPAGAADGRLRRGCSSRCAAWAGTRSRPHAAADPIVVAAEMVIALQTMVTRQFDVFDPVVVTVGHRSTPAPGATSSPTTADLRGHGAGLHRAEHGPAAGAGQCGCAPRSPRRTG